MTTTTTTSNQINTNLDMGALLPYRITLWNLRGSNSGDQLLFQTARSPVGSEFLTEDKTPRNSVRSGQVMTLLFNLWHAIIWSTAAGSYFSHKSTQTPPAIQWLFVTATETESLFFCNEMEKSLEFLGQTFPNGKNLQNENFSRLPDCEKEKRASFSFLRKTERQRERERERE